MVKRLQPLETKLQYTRISTLTRTRLRLVAHVGTYQLSEGLLLEESYKLR